MRRLWVSPELGGPDEIAQEIAGLLPAPAETGADNPGTAGPRGEAGSPIELWRNQDPHQNRISSYSK